jgi:general secretion pathway protein L
MSTLIIILPQDLAATATQFDYLLTPDGRAVASQSRAAAALLPLGGPSDVVAVVPAAALSWHQVQLPKGTLARGFLSDSNTSRLRAILEGLLEEHLLDDPAQLHFALAPGARDDAPVWVAVCDRAWLKAALQLLEPREISRLVPEFSPAVLGLQTETVRGGAEAAADGGRPAESANNTLHVIGTPDDARIVFAQNGIPTVLALSPGAVALAAWPESAAILAEPAVAALAESLFKRRVGLQQNGQRWLRACQTDWNSGWDGAGAGGWNLAQFDLVNSSSTRSWKRVAGWFAALARSPRWRMARWAAGALLVANLVGLNAWAWMDRASLNAKQQAVRDTLTSTFPGVKVVVDAPLQMNRELALLRQAAGGASSGDFETLMASFGALGLDNKALSAIEYRANEIRVKGLDLSGPALAQAQEQLKAQGLVLRADGDSLLIQAEASP